MKNPEQSPDQELIARNRFLEFLRAEDGLTLTELAVAAGVIAASLAATFGVFGTMTDAIFEAAASFF